jgi:TolB protein
MRVEIAAERQSAGPAMNTRRTIALLIVPFLAASSFAAEAPIEKIVWSPLIPALRLYLAAPDGTHQRSFMSNLEPNYNPSFSYDGRWIVFTSERFGSADVFRVHPDGSGIERLTDSAAFDDQAALSPDGRTLAFVSTRDTGTANIWLLDIPIHRFRNLTRNTAGNFRPTWSPDGKWIAFSSDRDMPRLRLIREWGPAWELMHRTAIYIVHPDGSGVRRLTAHDGSAGSPRWSPDGRRVVFDQVTDIDAMRHSLIKSEVESVDIDTGVRESSSSRKGPEHALNPSWSPDGSLLVFDREAPAQTSGVEVTRSRDLRYELIGGSGFNNNVKFTPGGAEFVYRSPTTQTLQFFRPNASDTTIFDGRRGKRRIGDEVALSADGRRIAFSISQSADPAQVGQIVVMNCDGSHLRVVTHDVGHDDYPSFSPDGSRLVYRVGDSNERAHTQRGLRILSLADGKVTKLTNGSDDFPAWSSRGDRIAFTGFESGDFEIYTIRPDGTGLRQLTHTHGNDAHEVWSPDGRWIAFVSSRMGWKDEGKMGGTQPYGEIFVMRADGTDVRQLTDDQWEEGVAGWAPSTLDAAAINAALHGRSVATPRQQSLTRN